MAFTLASVFSDHMVLQRGIRIPVWGSAEPGDKVTVQFAGQTKSAKAGPDGGWRVTLASLPASHEARDLTVRSTLAPQPVTLTDVLVGDVWVCSGQSNMQWPVGSSNNAPAEIASADYPNVRFFTVPCKAELRPGVAIEGAWSRCTRPRLPGSRRSGISSAVNCIARRACRSG